jgi:hypothetical protein
MFRLRFTLACALFCAGACEVSATVGGAAQVQVDGEASSSGNGSLDGVGAESSSSAPDREPSDGDPSGGDASGGDAGTSSEASSSDDGEGLASSSTDESTPSDAESSSSSSTVADEPDASSSSSGVDIGEFAVNCCAADDEPGCGDPELEACVCAIDPYCCDTAWDEACVNTTSYRECGDPCGALIPIPAGDCCDANLGGGSGCVDEYVQECVCGADPYCCTETWDDVCVGYVDEYGCGYCG